MASRAVLPAARPARSQKQAGSREVLAVGPLRGVNRISCWFPPGLLQLLQMERKAGNSVEAQGDPGRVWERTLRRKPLARRQDGPEWSCRGLGANYWP